MRFLYSLQALRRVFRSLCIVAVWFGAWGGMQVQAQSGQVAAAIASYDQGDYAKAAELFEQLISQSDRKNGHLYYNLGNTYYRLGEKGKALASFLEARRLLPRDPDVKANLKFVHEQVQDRLAVDQNQGILANIAFWLDSSTPKEVLCFAVILWVLGFGCLLAAFFIRKWALLKKPGKVLIVLACFGFIAFAVSWQENDVWGAVTVKKAEVKSGPGEHNTIVFELHEGAPFVARQQENGWYQIELSDGKKGWLPRKSTLVWGLNP